MTYRATHDALTGLVNRAEFELRLRRTLNKALEDKTQRIEQTTFDLPVEQVVARLD